MKQITKIRHSGDVLDENEDGDDNDDDDEYFPDATAEDSNVYSSDSSDESNTDDRPIMWKNNVMNKITRFKVRGLHELFNFDSHEEIQNVVPDSSHGPEKKL